MTQPQMPGPVDGRPEALLDRAEESAQPGITPVAVVGTLAEFRRDPVPHDLGELVRFVGAIRPDLLCLDMTLDQWQRRDFGGLPPEYRDALLPLAEQTDIVVIPIGERGLAAAPRPNAKPVLIGVRGWLDERLRIALAGLERGRGPVDVDQGLHHAIAGLLYHVIDRVRGPATETTRVHRHALAERVVELARRDPGRRILVVVNARHCHQLRATLRSRPEVAVVRYSDL